jgi:hypothetical protein
MRYLGLVALILGVVTMRGSGVSSASRDAQLSPVRQASLFLRTDRSRYLLRDTISIEAGIRNDGREPIYVYNRIAWGPGGGLVLG